MSLMQMSSKSLHAEEVFPHAPQEIVDKWDREWMIYLSTEAKEPHLVRYTQLELAADIAAMGRREVFNTALTRFRGGAGNALLRIWAKGDEIVGKNVVEIGSGAGFLGKQLGLVARTYLGLDVSQIAVAMARGNSPDNCEYLHLSERDDIFAAFGKWDTMVGREFFIHQNFENALWVTALGERLLRPGGVLAADFYLPNRKIPQGVLHPAKSPLDKTYASCAFIFSDAEINEVAQHSRLTVESIEDDLPEQRKLVVFRKPA